MNKAEKAAMIKDLLDRATARSVSFGLFLGLLILLGAYVFNFAWNAVLACLAVLILNSLLGCSVPFALKPIVGLTLIFHLANRARR